MARPGVCRPEPSCAGPTPRSCWCRSRGSKSVRANSDFVAWFRSVAPYVNAFRSKIFVIAFGGEVVADGKFFELVHDLNLLASLGVRLVLVHGARPQIEDRLNEPERGHDPEPDSDARAQDALPELVEMLQKRHLPFG